MTQKRSEVRNESYVIAAQKDDGRIHVFASVGSAVGGVPVTGVVGCGASGLN